VAYRGDNRLSFLYVTAGILSWLIISRQVWSTLLLAAVAGVGYWFRQRRDAALTRTSDAGVAHLVDRVEMAIRVVERDASQGERSRTSVRER
jgi:uncharacterized membrane protein